MTSFTRCTGKPVVNHAKLLLFFMLNKNVFYTKVLFFFFFFWSFPFKILKPAIFIKVVKTLQVYAQ